MVRDGDCWRVALLTSRCDVPRATQSSDTTETKNPLSPANPVLGPVSGAMHWCHALGPANAVGLLVSVRARHLWVAPGALTGTCRRWRVLALTGFAATKPQFFSSTGIDGAGGKVYRAYLTGSCDTTRATHSSDTTGLENPSVLLHPL